MKIFQHLYDATVRLAGKPAATYYLAAISFSESSFFPIPPDVLLAPMVIAKRCRAWFYATLTTITSVLGGVLGYLIGYYLFNEVGEPLIAFYHAEAKFAQMTAWYASYGVLIVLIAGFTPIPYKLFTITSGLMALEPVSFVLASLLGRGGRFYLVAGLLYFGGEALSDFLRRKIDLLGWGCVLLLLILYLIWQW